LRKYETGNDLRLVHWKASARAGTLMVRNNVVPHEPQLTTVLDTKSDSYAGDDFEHAVRIVASLCVAARRSGVPMLLRTTGGDAASSDRPSLGGSPVLDLMASVVPSTREAGLGWLPTLAPRQAGLSLVVVTGQPGPTALRAVSMVYQRYEQVTLVQVGDPSTSTRSVPGAFVMSVASSSEFESAWNKAITR
jgi:uncharacterized protein (DUF58 family)